MNVFLSADDCKKIAPYIEIPKDWEWWYYKGVLFAKNKSYYDMPCLISVGNIHVKYYGILDIHKFIPAIDTQLLGVELLSMKEVDGLKVWLSTDPDGGDMEGVYLEIWDGNNLLSAPFFGLKSELENRRDAMMYLIDNNLIEKVKRGEYNGK